MESTTQLPSAQSLIPPGSYLLERDGPSARIFNIQSESGHDSLISEHSHNFNPLTIFRKNPDKDGFRPLDRPAFYIRYADKAYTLYEGPDAQDESRRLVAIKPEKHLASTSTYTEARGAKRQARMYKARGRGGNPWWSVNRTLDDFDDNRYKWRTSLNDNLTCVRSDGVVIAQFQRANYAWTKIGTLQIKEAVSPALLHLLLSTTLIKYQQLRKRRLSQ